MPRLNLKRVYLPPSGDDGFRVLVDRLWPRGLSKQNAKVDLWLKDIAPSNELRQWFNHDPIKWVEFVNKYRAELKTNKKSIDELKQAIQDNKKVTLLFAAADEKHNNAAALKKLLNL